jgi:histone H3/H4
VERAMQHFLEGLARHAWEMANEDNRRNIKTQDIAACVHAYDEYYWAKPDFEKPPAA